MKKTVLIFSIICLSMLFAGCGSSGSKKPGSSIKDKNGSDRREETASEQADLSDSEEYDSTPDLAEWGEQDNEEPEQKRVTLKKSSDSDVSDWSKRTVDSENGSDERDVYENDFDADSQEYNPNPDLKDWADEYLLPESDSRYLTENDLDALDPDDLRYARNEIYARRGRKFSDPALQAYFDEKNWYNGTIDPKNFDEKNLNEYESYNRDFIVKYEKDHGIRK